MENPTTTLDQSRLFFIIGIGRSGTTLLQEIMNTFDDFCNLEEARLDGSDSISCYESIKKNNDFSALEDFIRKRWTRRYFVEKTPSSISNLPHLHVRYPRANYFFLERNPVKIALSQLNQYPMERLLENRRRAFQSGQITDRDWYECSYELYLARRMHKAIRIQRLSKPRFDNQVTVRYERLVGEPQKVVEEIENAFEIKANLAGALECLSKPSNSSKDNRYDIKEIKDVMAKELLRKCCHLWGYDLGDDAKLESQRR